MNGSSLPYSWLEPFDDQEDEESLKEATSYFQSEASAQASSYAAYPSEAPAPASSVNWENSDLAGTGEEPPAWTNPTGRKKRRASIGINLTQSEFDDKTVYYRALPLLNSDTPNGLKITRCKANKEYKLIGNLRIASISDSWTSLAPSVKRFYESAAQKALDFTLTSKDDKSGAYQYPEPLRFFTEKSYRPANSTAVFSQKFRNALKENISNFLVKETLAQSTDAKYGSRVGYPAPSTAPAPATSDEYLDYNSTFDYPEEDAAAPGTLSIGLNTDGLDDEYTLPFAPASTTYAPGWTPENAHLYAQSILAPALPTVPAFNDPVPWSINNAQHAIGTPAWAHAAWSSLELDLHAPAQKE